MVEALQAVTSLEEAAPYCNAIEVLYQSSGIEALDDLVKLRGVSAGIAAALVCSEVPVLEMFTAQEVVDGACGCLFNLGADPAILFEYVWAWFAITHGELSDGDRWDLVMTLIERAPDDDDALWMIGDGPLAELAAIPGMCERIESLRESNPQLDRIRTLVEDNP